MKRKKWGASDKNKGKRRTPTRQHRDEQSKDSTRRDFRSRDSEKKPEHHYPKDKERPQVKNQPREEARAEQKPRGEFNVQDFKKRYVLRKDSDEPQEEIIDNKMQRPAPRPTQRPSSRPAARTDRPAARTDRPSEGFRRPERKFKPGEKSARPSGKDQRPQERSRRPGERFEKPKREFDTRSRAQKKERFFRRKSDGAESYGTIVSGEVQKNRRGFAFLLQKDGDIFIPEPQARKLVTGDLIQAWIDPRSKELLKFEVKKHNLKQFIGTYDSNLGSRIVVLEEKNNREEVHITENPKIMGLRNGDKVLVEITSYEPVLEGVIHQTFGPKLAPKLDTFSVVVRSNWPQEFTEETTKLAEKLSAEIQASAKASDYEGRKDMRDKHFITIDGKDARDFDDAIYLEKTNAGFVLYVAIADVSEFVRQETSLDDEAFARSTSVYFPEWVIPMLPEALSNGACSLRPDEEKLTLTCEMHYSFDGKKKSSKFYETVIKSHRRCIYEDVQKEYDAGDEFWKNYYELFRRIRENRFRRGALDLDLPETKVVLDENSNTIDIARLNRVDSHKVIEEFMIAANESVTEIMEREGWPFVYRVHEPPKVESLERFHLFAMALGIRPNLGDGNDPVLFSKFVDSIKDKPFAQVLHYMLLRSLKQARYEPVNAFHFGLASKAYTHFTSPIRRYPDLIVHRLLKKFIVNKKLLSDERANLEEYLLEACDHCSKQERKAEELDRKVIKIKKARFMEPKLGETFEAMITNVASAGLHIELKKWFIDGFLAMDELGEDYFEYIEEKLMIKGKRSGQKFRIGDIIQATLLRVDIDNGFCDFTLENTQD